MSDFAAFYKKNKRINFGIMIFFLLLLVLVVFLIESSIYVLIGIVVVYFIITTFTSKKAKASLNEKANNVVTTYFNNMDSYIFDEEGFTNVKFNSNDKFDKQELLDLKLVKNVEYVGGRDYIIGKFYDSDFIAGDGLIRTEEEKEDGKKQRYIVFLGKMIIVNTKTKLTKGRAIIYLKGNGANGPTDIDDLTEYNEVLSSKYRVFSNGNIEDLLTEEVKNILEEFSINETLLDMFVVVEPKKLAVGLSYSDTLMTIPLFEKFSREANSEYKKNFALVTKLMKEMKR